MDVKLGQRSYDPYASQEKREQQIRKYPLMEEIGFLVLGLRVSLSHGAVTVKARTGLNAGLQISQCEKSKCRVFV